MPEHPFAARLRKDAAHSRRDRPAPENSFLLLTPDEADALADVLEAAEAVSGDSCTYCSAKRSRLALRLSALDRLARRVAGT